MRRHREGVTPSRLIKTKTVPVTRLGRCLESFVLFRRVRKSLTFQTIPKVASKSSLISSCGLFEGGPKEPRAATSYHRFELISPARVLYLLE